MTLHSSVCVLVVAGLDPGGGAGIAADVRAMRAAGAFACPVLATITVQSTSGLVGQHPVASSLVMAQANEVIAHQRVRALKTGALGTAANVRAVARLVRAHPELVLVVDPVRLPSRGRGALVDAAGFDALRRSLVPLAALVTANADEASALTSLRVHDLASARHAARALVAMGARAALVKGGHLRTRDAVDVLALAGRDAVIELAAPRLTWPKPLHGGGCALASIIAARLALASDSSTLTEAALVRAVRWSKRCHHRLLATRVVDVGEGSTVIFP